MCVGVPGSDLNTHTKSNRLSKFMQYLSIHYLVIEKQIWPGPVCGYVVFCVFLIQKIAIIFISVYSQTDQSVTGVGACEACDVLD